MPFLQGSIFIISVYNINNILNLPITHNVSLFLNWLHCWELHSNGKEKGTHISVSISCFLPENVKFSISVRIRSPNQKSEEVLNVEAIKNIHYHQNKVSYFQFILIKKLVCTWAVSNQANEAYWPCFSLRIDCE